VVAERPQLLIESSGADVTAPAPTLSSPANGANLSDDTPAFSGTAGTAPGDDGTVTVLVWQGSDTSGPPALSLPAAALAGGAFSVAPDTSLEDGAYTVAVEQADAAGNVGRSAERSFTLDTEPPALDLTTPADGSTTTDTTPSFAGTAGIDTGDASNVSVQIWAGSTASGSALQTLSTTRASDGAFDVSPSTPLAGGTYTARARQADAAGNTGTSALRTFTVDAGPPPAEPVTLFPLADAYVDTAQPTRNFGTLTQLRTDASPVVRSYLRFDVSGWSPGSSRATLRLMPKSLNKTGVSVAPVANDTWSETGINAGNAPAPGATAGTTAAPQTNVPLTLDVTDAIDGNGLVSLALTSTSSTATALGSREAPSADRPRLIVESTGPDTTPPAITLGTPADGATTSDATPAFAGTAGTAPGDSATVTVDIWAGSAISGSPARTLTATRSGTTGAYSVSPSSALPDGVHTARAEQSDNAGNVGRSATTTFTVDPSTAGDPTIAAAGDIACPPNVTSSGCRQMETSDLLVQLDPDAVVTLGDNQYEFGEYQNFLSVFDPSWGRVKDRIYPATGNHEYGNSVNGQMPSGCDVAISGDPRSYACGYFDYYNGKGNMTGRAGQRGQGYYAFDVGSWRIYVLNSNCSLTGAPGCAAGSAQEQWLRTDLAANPRVCTAMTMHHPMFTSDVRGYDTATFRAGLRPLWDAFYEHGGDLALMGHSHFYERFQPMRPDGTADSTAIQQFIVGTGGRNAIQPSTTDVEPNSVNRFATFGVAEFTLHASSYEWRYVPIPGQNFSDVGSRSCH
jgi:hypothetical protein